MRDPGLSEAIRAAGGISELARQIGISQPSVSNWIRVPAERVISVEAITGVDRAAQSSHEGDLVKIAPCRPLSRRKSWQLVEVLEKAAT